MPPAGAHLRFQDAQPVAADANSAPRRRHHLRGHLGERPRRASRRFLVASSLAAPTVGASRRCAVCTAERSAVLRRSCLQLFDSCFSGAYCPGAYRLWVPTGLPTELGIPPWALAAGSLFAPAPIRLTLCRAPPPSAAAPQTLAMEDVRNLCNMKIFVDTDDDMRLARRIKRDTIDRGRDVNGALLRTPASRPCCPDPIRV